MVIDRAIVSDQGLKNVYVIGAGNKAEYRRVSTGPLQPDGLRVIRDGLKPGEWIAVGALQQIRPRMQVQTEQIPMPTLQGQQDQAPAPAAAPQAPAPNQKQAAPPGKR